MGLGGKRERGSLGDVVSLGWRSEGPPVSRGESEVEEWVSCRPGRGSEEDQSGSRTDPALVGSGSVE